MWLFAYRDWEIRPTVDSNRQLCYNFFCIDEFFEQLKLLRGVSFLLRKVNYAEASEQSN